MPAGGRGPPSAGLNEEPMTIQHSCPRPLASVRLILLAAAAFGTGAVRPAAANSLLVSDSTHVLAYDANTGSSTGTFITSGVGGISLPRKMLSRDGYLYVGNFGYPGVGRFDLFSGSFIDALYPT